MRLKLAALALYSLSGQPVLYYGTETGLSQEQDVADGTGLDEARLPMLWGVQQDPALLAYFRRLGTLRARFSPEQGASRRTVALDSDSGLYAYIWEGEDSLFMVAFNLCDVVRTLNVNNPFSSAPEDRLNNQVVEVHEDQLEINLAPLSGAWIA